MSNSMYEFTMDLECAGHPVSNLDIGVDATLVGDAYDLNRVYLWIGSTRSEEKHRHERKDDIRTFHYYSNGDVLANVWREVPSDDPFYPAIIEELNRQRGEVIVHLMREAA